MTTTSYPEVPPPGTPTVLIKAGLWRCGLCITGHHGSCPAMVRNGRVRLPSDLPERPPTGPFRLVQCYCCGTDQPERCLDCGTIDSGELDRGNWVCLYGFACQQRIEQRQANSSLYQMLQRCKSDAAVRRRTIREGTLRILGEVPPDEDELLDYIERRQQKLRQIRPTSGQCECCGESTRGGRFLPGHDAKLKSILRGRARSGDVDAQAELEQRGWN